jgi:hypothetical protein
MTFEEFEKFLSELESNGDVKAMLMDFVSLGGTCGYDEGV